jgi:hypothetical protein
MREQSRARELAGFWLLTSSKKAVLDWTSVSIDGCGLEELVFER